MLKLINFFIKNYCCVIYLYKFQYKIISLFYLIYFGYWCVYIYDSYNFGFKNFTKKKNKFRIFDIKTLICWYLHIFTYWLLCILSKWVGTMNIIQTKCFVPFKIYHFCSCFYIFKDFWIFRSYFVILMSLVYINICNL